MERKELDYQINLQRAIVFVLNPLLSSSTVLTNTQDMVELTSLALTGAAKEENLPEPPCSSPSVHLDKFLFSTTSLNSPLEQRVQCLRRIQAQRDRDLNRAQRLDPPISEDVAMSFASKVLDLS